MANSRDLVDALAEVDPGFTELCKTLFGDAFDPADAWAFIYGVSKMSPDPSSVSVKRGISGKRPKRGRLMLASRQQDGVGGVEKADEAKWSAAGAVGAGAAGVGLLRSSRKDKASSADVTRRAGDAARASERSFIEARSSRETFGRMRRNVSQNKERARELLARQDQLDARAKKLGAQYAKIREKEGVSGVDRSRKGLMDRYELARKHPVASNLAFESSRQANANSNNARMYRELSSTRNPAWGTLYRNHQDALSNARALQADSNKLASEASGYLKRSKGKTAAAVTLGGVGAGLAANSLVATKRRRNTVSKADEGSYDIVWAGEFSKTDDEKRQAFGWASVVEVNGMPVIDRQGDWITPEELEKAAYDYVIKSRKGGDQHKRDGEAPFHASDMIESFVVTPEKIEKMGLPKDTPVGWWVGYKVHNDETWDKIKKGHHTGFSIHGRGKRQEIPVDEAMGY